MNSTSLLGILGPVKRVPCVINAAPPVPTSRNNLRHGLIPPVLLMHHPGTYHDVYTPSFDISSQYSNRYMFAVVATIPVPPLHTCCLTSPACPHSIASLNTPQQCHASYICCYSIHGSQYVSRGGRVSVLKGISLIPPHTPIHFAFRFQYISHSLILHQPYCMCALRMLGNKNIFTPCSDCMQINNDNFSVISKLFI